MRFYQVKARIKNFWLNIRIGMVKMILGPNIMICWKFGQNNEFGDIIIGDGMRGVVADCCFDGEYNGPIVPYPPEPIQED